MVAWVLAWVCAANRGYGNTGSGYYVDSNAVLGMRSRRDTMAIYRKKSLFCAFQWFRCSVTEGVCIPPWFDRLVASVVINQDCSATIATTAGDEITVCDGDYIIAGTRTKLETCKPSIFEATYKKVGNWDAFDSDHMDSILDT